MFIPNYLRVLIAIATAPVWVPCLLFVVTGAAVGWMTDADLPSR